MTFHRIFDRSNPTAVTNAYISGTHEVTPDFLWGSRCLIVSFSKLCFGDPGLSFCTIFPIVVSVCLSVCLVCLSRLRFVASDYPFGILTYLLLYMNTNTFTSLNTQSI